MMDQLISQFYKILEEYPMMQSVFTSILTLLVIYLKSKLPTSWNMLIKQVKMAYKQNKKPIQQQLQEDKLLNKMFRINPQMQQLIKILMEESKKHEQEQRKE